MDENNIFGELNNNNFVLYAAKFYTNKHCVSINEFEDDLKIFVSINKSLNRYNTKGNINQNLVLNNIIIIYNNFDIKAATKMLLYKINKENYSALKTFLVYLNYIKEDDLIDITLDFNIVNILRKI